jgi:dTDP-4-dehydrorhamnose reductase
LKLVITGAGGLLGSALLAMVKGHEVYSLYNEHAPSTGIPVRLDLRDKNQVTEILRKIKPDAIVHTTALTDVDRCERDHTLAKAINYDATTTIAKSAKDLGAFLVYISTDYVFDGEKGMYNEEDIPRPINFYGHTKLMGEQSIKELLSDYLIARTSVIYGSTPSSGKVNFALWLLDSLSSGKTVNVAMNQFVSPTLNTNLAEMIMECLERRVKGILHLSGASRVSRLEFALEICKTWSLNPSLINPVDMSKMNWYAPRPRDSSLDVTKASSILMRKPASIKDSLYRLKEELNTPKRG